VSKSRYPIPTATGKSSTTCADDGSGPCGVAKPEPKPSCGIVNPSFIFDIGITDIISSFVNVTSLTPALQKRFPNPTTPVSQAGGGARNGDSYHVGEEAVGKG
jgi:hypothetical protein